MKASRGGWGAWFSLDNRLENAKSALKKVASNLLNRLEKSGLS